MNTENFPVDLSKLKPLALDPSKMTLTDEQRQTLKSNIQLCRDAIVFFTALSSLTALSAALLPLFINN